MRRFTIVLLSTVALVLTGCAAEDAEPGVATAGRPASAVASSAGEAKGDRQKFEKCMSESGVDRNNATEVDDAVITKAAEKCNQFLPNGGELPKLDPQDVEKMRGFSKCMREAGFPEFPDPGPDGSIPADYAPSPSEREKMRPAYETCSKELTGIAK